MTLFNPKTILKQVRKCKYSHDNISEISLSENNTLKSNHKKAFKKKKIV